MINFIRSAFILILCMSYGASVLAQDAALLPNAKQTFLDNNGKPLSGGKVYFYIPSTSTFKTTWQDADQNTANSNPVILDSAGRALIYGDGEYRQVVRDRNNNLIWDALTNSTGSGGGGGGTVGDGDLVGTIKPWAGLNAPNQYLFAYGQEVARATYPELFTAITLSTAVFCTNGSPTLTGIGDTTQIPIGSPVEVSCALPGTTVLSKTTSTVVMSGNANITTSAVAVFLPWGNGNGTSTFNLPDLRGRIIAGRDNMGGVAASRLTSTYFGTSASAIGALGGSQSHTLTIAEMAAHDHGGVTGGMSSAISAVRSITTSAASTGPNESIPQAPTSIAHTHTIASQGSGTAFTIVQPTVTSNYIIKVTPDTVSSDVLGVASLGGMTGVIACGSYLLCTGNTISVSISPIGGNNTEIQFNDNGDLSGSPHLTWIDPILSIGLAGVTGQISIAGLTSGDTKIQASAIASGTLTLPAATDTLVARATTDTLSNKTLVAPVLGVATATSINGLGITATTGGVLTIANSKTLTASNSITLAGTDSTTMTFPSTNANIAALNIASQTLTGGVAVTSQNITTGSYTVNCSTRPLQYISNNGAFTITAPSGDGSCALLVTNTGSAGTITFSGWSVGGNTGDIYATTNGNSYILQVLRINGLSTYSWKALQ